jgi:hypothetical protein
VEVVGVDYFAELWKAAQQAGPFGVMFLLYAVYALNDERKQERARYEDLVKRFVEVASDTGSTLKDWKNMLTQAQGPRK